MDTTNLRDNSQRLIAHLENADYSKAYISAIRNEILRILQLAVCGEISDYADVYSKYEQSGYSKKTLENKRMALNKIAYFDMHGIYPDGTKMKSLIKPRGSYCFLNDEYKAVIDYFVEAETTSGRKTARINSRASTGAVFFLELQRMGIDKLSDITEKNVLDVFASPKKNYNEKIQIAAVLKSYSLQNPSCEKILAFLPAFRKRRKNIQYLNEDELLKIKQVLSENSTILSLRDKAIGLLALYTGLRSCDIANLKIDEVDFAGDTLNICQKKTGVPLTLPLSAIVGNAIWDYMGKERPKTDSEYVFISQRRPYGNITRLGFTYGISVRIMKAAGIRKEPGEQKGLHLFRHNLATKLLGNKIPRVVISGITGHLDPKSLDTYLSADFVHLKKCALSIERFPVAERVFEA